MTHPELVAECMKRIDVRGLAIQKAIHASNTWSKFYDVPAFVSAAATHALRFDAELSRNARCADVGCGFGYVALALEVLGHSCIAWDTPAQILKNIAGMIPVKKRIFKKIERGCGNFATELPGEFDLIFLHGVFPMRDAAGWWIWPDYAMLTIGLLGCLMPGGRLEIIANRGDQIPIMCDPHAWSGLVEYPGSEFTVAVGDNMIDVRRQATVAAGAI